MKAMWSTETNIPEDIRQRLTEILKREDWSIVFSVGELTGRNKVPTRIYELRIPDKKCPIVAGWELHSMIHCCGICVSANSYVYWTWQKHGLGTVLNRLRVHLARELGFSLLLCTDRAANTAQRRILERNGWKDLHSFTNRFTGNEVFISMMRLR